MDGPALDPAFSAGLGWPIRTSFARYVAALPDGRVGFSGGVAFSSAHGLVFPPAGSAFDPANGAGILRFAGGVRFQGHFGALSLAIVEPWLECGADEGALSVAAATRDGETRIIIARFTFTFIPGAPACWRGQALALTREGAALFNDVYAEGDPLDPFVALLREGS